MGAGELEGGYNLQLRGRGHNFISLGAQRGHNLVLSITTDYMYVYFVKTN
jgi:hypothetical protein